jgi:hypothetical protein
VPVSPNLAVGLVIAGFHGNGVYKLDRGAETRKEVTLESGPTGAPAEDEWDATEFTLVLQEKVAPAPVWSGEALLNDPIYHVDATLDATFDLNNATLDDDVVDPHPDLRHLHGVFHCEDEAGYGLLKAMGLGPSGR